MHSIHNKDYTVYYHGDFSQIKYIDNQTKIEKEIPPALFALLYSMVADDLCGQINDLIDNAINEHNVIGTKYQPYWRAENEQT